MAEAGCRDGCEGVARQIQQAVGGDIRVIRPRGDAPVLGGVRNLGERSFRNPSGGIVRGWAEHHVVVRDGRVFDAFTGPEGEAIDVYKSRWEFPDAIHFGF